MVKFVKSEDAFIDIEWLHWKGFPIVTSLLGNDVTSNLQQINFLYFV